MPGTSVYYTILTDVQTTIQGLGLSGIASDHIVIRKLPKAEEGLDSLPLLCVVPSETPEEVTPLSFEDESNVGYWVDVVLIAAGNHDFLTNLDQYLAWRQQIRRALGKTPLAGASTVWRSDVFPLVPLDRDAVNDNYDYSGLSILFQSHEPTQ